MSRSRVFLIAAATLLALQLVPLSRSNPPVESEMPAPPEVRAILDRSCADCHSHETRWPWYAYLAPASWLVVYDVHHAREHLNLSTWQRYDAKRQLKKTRAIGEEVEEGEMPLWTYLLAHPDAQLSAEERETLRRFSEERARLLELAGS